MRNTVPTTCMRCAVGCGHVNQSVDVGYGIDIVRGDVAHPVNQGLACQRGIRESKEPEGRWLTRPLIREGDELLPTTWDVALGRVVERFASTIGHDRDGLAVLGSGQQTNEAAYALGKLARGGFGTRYYDANTTLCMASAVTAYYDAFGSDAPPCTYDDIPDARSHVVWGANPAVAHPVMFRWIQESANDDSRLIVVDPVESETGTVADTHVSPDPGGDLALARAVLARLVERDAIDDAFIDAATTGFDALRADLPTAEEGATTAGVALDVVDQLADAFADSTLLYWGMGVNQSTQGTATAGALIDLCLATGNLGPGTGPFSLTGQANSMGTRVCSSKGTWPGHRSFDDPDEQAVVADAWDISTERLPDDAGPGPVGIVEAVDDGPVETVWTVATNPVAGLPDAGTVRERLDEAFLVVQDAFRTETVELADVVLPAATWGETDGTTMNMERRVSRVRSVTGTPTGVRTDLDIIIAIAEGVVPGLMGRSNPRDVFEELTTLTAGTSADLSGISYPRLEEEKAVRWPAPDPTSSGGYRYHDDGDWSFATPTGRARFSTATHRGLPEPTNEEFPLTLTTGRTADGYNTGVRSRPPEADAPPLVRVHPDTLDSLDIHGETAVVTSRRAEIPVRTDPNSAVPRGVVWLSIHHPRTNELTLPATDPRSDEPNYKQCAVRLAPRPDERTVANRAEVTGDD
ncbi:molybdopterin oxidoreductase family protein [Haladaptatus sp. AB618]|uniref:assimilatory nitrate reductase NasA n=1 Tax=Haladaptatus sp. AB618 TaxID=2934173 RepID=UPI00209C350C|nr:assimilatory nitrate reductase NasA [Haladaptatus sp. AB618]MCO8252454.1 molybdopterin oxidoreductase family protein [Haladaptatus sp. AB618]